MSRSELMLTVANRGRTWRPSSSRPDWSTTAPLHSFLIRYSASRSKRSSLSSRQSKYALYIIYRIVSILVLSTCCIHLHNMLMLHVIVISVASQISIFTGRFQAWVWTTAATWRVPHSAAEPRPLCSFSLMVTSHSCRSATAPTTPARRGGTAATAPTRPTCCPAGWRRSPGCWKCPATSCSSTSSTCRAWASFWSKSGLSLQPAGLYLPNTLEAPLPSNCHNNWTWNNHNDNGYWQTVSKKKITLNTIYT